MKLEKIKESIEFQVAAQSKASVLILGPTGTGKTRLARQIHEAGPRSKGPFVTVNLGTLNSGTLESELFGHEKGAFTGADQKRIGRLESAHGGTVFLDEIAELPLSAQTRLLDFCENHTIVPVGSNREVRVDTRIIAATHQNLEEKVRKKEFREDLYHRLKIIELEVPPLVERGDEFDLIVHDLIDELSQKYQKKILSLTPRFADALESYLWPGNIRELKNVLEFAVIANRTGILDLCDFSPKFLKECLKLPVPSRSVSLDFGDWGLKTIDLKLNYEADISSFEKRYLEMALARCSGNLTRAAERLGMNKSTLYRRVKEYGIVCSD